LHLKRARYIRDEYPLLCHIAPFDLSTLVQRARLEMIWK
jgi:hypothetical protein